MLPLLEVTTHKNLIMTILIQMAMMCLVALPLQQLEQEENLQAVEQQLVQLASSKWYLWCINVNKRKLHMLQMEEVKSTLQVPLR